MLEQLELEQADLVTMPRLDELVRSAGIGTDTRTVASRLRERGWLLLPASQRGVWEFVPAAVAGARSRGGSTRLLRAAMARVAIPCGLTFQAAAWGLGLGRPCTSVG